MISVVPFSQEHVDAVAEIEKASFRTPWSKELIKKELTNPLAVYFIAEDAGRVVGYCGFYKVNGEADMVKIATASDFRRRGAARLLLTVAFDCLRADGISDVTLEVNQKNSQAIALYLSFGFIEEGRRPKYYEGTDDAILYRLVLR